jgi:hypothetical protein
MYMGTGNPVVAPERGPGDALSEWTFFNHWHFQRSEILGGPRTRRTPERSPEGTAFGACRERTWTRRIIRLQGLAGR